MVCCMVRVGQGSGEGESSVLAPSPECHILFPQNPEDPPEKPPPEKPPENEVGELV